MIRRIVSHPLVILVCEEDLREVLRRLWPFVLRRKYDRDVRGLQEALEQERARVRALQWWRGGAA